MAYWTLSPASILVIMLLIVLIPLAIFTVDDIIQEIKTHSKHTH